MPPAAAPMDDMVEEILLRFPSEDPGRLFRASLVSKPWRSLLTSFAFSRRYRQFHRTLPLLGFFVNNNFGGSRFSPLSPTSPFLPFRSDGRTLVVVDSRHGLVLLKVNLLWEGENPTLIVWDPVGRRQWELPPPDMAHTTNTYNDAAVLCAADGCDHLGCSGGPFLVAYMRTDLYGAVYASVFSSQTRAWSLVTSCQGPGVYFRIISGKLKAFVGNALYFMCDPPPMTTILRCDLVSQELSMIDGPNVKWDDYVLMTTDDGGLGSLRLELVSFS
nr:uncharacterized protein LOC109752794 [Aegilops tauschii subsp. strangulata]